MAEGINAKTIILLVVGFLMVAILTPIAMTNIMALNDTGVDTTVITIFQVLLPILYVIGVAIRYIPGGKK